MADKFFKRLFSYFPRNYLLQRPLTAGMVLMIFLFGFTVVYNPVGVHAGYYLGFTLTMAFYAVAVGFFTWAGIKLLSLSDELSHSQSWNILKEFAAIAIVLFVMGTGLYLTGFLLEEPVNRFNLSTFFDSLFRGMLVGIIPFFFFTFMGIFSTRKEVLAGMANPEREQENETPVAIHSQLKKEGFSLLPSEFVYAESDGNYVVFYLIRDGVLKKEIIRNSISNIEKQLSEIEFMMRVHRAYIVNLKRVKEKKGNVLGFRLKLEGADTEIPVSRNKAAQFKEAFARLNRF